MPRKKGRLSLDKLAALPVSDGKLRSEYLRLNRQQICWTEINAAVRLFLVDEDPISAHLLASAANEIMDALSEGKPGVGLNDLRAAIKAAGVTSNLSDETFQSLKHPYNFLKHSSADSSVENNFSIEDIVMTIYSAVHSYRLLFGDLSAEMTVFEGVVLLCRVHWLEGTPGFEEKLRIANKIPLIINASRKTMCEFGRNMLKYQVEKSPI